MDILDAFLSIFEGILNLLPRSPFASAMSLVKNNEYMQYLAWFIPFPQMIGILEMWCMAIGAYYIYSVILRAAKAIQ